MRAPEHIQSLIPYEAGKPIEELERELHIGSTVKLASNENPLGPSTAVIDAVRKSLSTINRYPDGGGFYLKRDLAAHHRVDSGNIILGNGSNEILELLSRTFLLPGDEAIMADQSFVVYGMVTQAAAGKKIVVPLKEYTHDLTGMADAVTERTRLIFIANPNNPTGTVVGKEEFERFIKRVPDSLVVVVDEAYAGYVETPDFPEPLEQIKRGRNVIILRTFSKIYGLAGVRIGYGLAGEEIIALMNRVRQPFNSNSVAQVAARAALSDREHLAKSREINITGKGYLYREFKKLGLSTVPTETNFILVQVGSGRRVYEALLKKGVIVRPMDGYRFPSHIRVTIGTPEENRRFIAGLETVIS